jgi:hypothetical protein
MSENCSRENPGDNSEDLLDRLMPEGSTARMILNDFEDPDYLAYLFQIGRISATEAGIDPRPTIYRRKSSIETRLEDED